jgi:hypothetical protein
MAAVAAALVHVQQRSTDEVDAAGGCGLRCDGWRLWAAAVPTVGGPRTHKPRLWRSGHHARRHRLVGCGAMEAAVDHPELLASHFAAVHWRENT